MIKTDVIIVGGGPGGAACAWRLKQHNVDCLILDQKSFPRPKTCAGWVTPEVVKDIGLDAGDYPHGFTTFTSFQVSIRGFKFTLRTHQYAIRRYEFDDWQVRRAGAPVLEHTVKDILCTPEGYEIDGKYCARYLVGAGGTNCPVYRNLFSAENPRPKGQLIVAQEEEFPYDYTDECCQLWFLENKLPGYAWYVPKANGYVNVGVGGKAEELKARGDSLINHWNLLAEKLERLRLVRGHDYKPSGHSYYLRQRRMTVRKGNAFLVGDAAGLATLDMGEGISPAIKSGLMAAGAILNHTPYSVDSIGRYSLPSLIGLGFG